MIRKTKSVKAVLNKFEQTDDAVSVVALAEELHLEMNKTTVYRILERLEQDGQFHSFIGKDGRKWYAKGNRVSPNRTPKTHPHFQCKECGKVECLSLEIQVPSLPHHQVDAAELLLIGKCSECLS